MPSVYEFDPMSEMGVRRFETGTWFIVQCVDGQDRYFQKLDGLSFVDILGDARGYRSQSDAKEVIEAIWLSWRADKFYLEYLFARGSESDRRELFGHVAEKAWDLHLARISGGGESIWKNAWDEAYKVLSSELAMRNRAMKKGLYCGN